MVYSPRFEEYQVSAKILRRYPFSSELQRMSVVVELPDEEKNVFCKGSPEMIQGLCKSETIPKNFEKMLRYYTSQGCYVLAIAYSDDLQYGMKKKKQTNINYKHQTNNNGLDMAQLDTTHRKTLEANLNFGGFLVFRNELKPESYGVISELRDAKITPVMATGDHLQNAVFIAYQVGLVDKLFVNAKHYNSSAKAAGKWVEVNKGKH